jgi:hypothetical protein
MLLELDALDAIDALDTLDALDVLDTGGLLLLLPPPPQPVSAFSVTHDRTVRQQRRAFISNVSISRSFGLFEGVAYQS